MQHVKCDPCDPGSECKGAEAKAAHTCKCVPGPPPPPSPPGQKYMLLDDRNVIDATAEIVLGKVTKVKGSAGMGSMIHVDLAPCGSIGMPRLVVRGDGGSGLRS